MRRVKVGEIAVEIVGVGPIAERDRRHIEPGKSAVGLVHDIDADFFLHHVALIFQVLVVDFQRAHAVRFEPEHAFQSVGGNGFVIIRHIVAGRAIQHSATGVNQLDVLHFGGIRGTLEHHMFEEMCEAAAAPRLKPETDFVIHA